MLFFLLKFIDINNVIRVKTCTPTNPSDKNLNIFEAIFGFKYVNTTGIIISGTHIIILIAPIAEYLLQSICLPSKMP